MKRFERIDTSRRKRFNSPESFIFLSMVKSCFSFSISFFPRAGCRPALPVVNKIQSVCRNLNVFYKRLSIFAKLNI